MKEILSTITKKGQVTIPAEVRKHLGLKSREKVAFVIDDAGDVHLKGPTYPTIAALRGAAGSLARPVSWDEVQQIVEEDKADEAADKLGVQTRP